MAREERDAGIQYKIKTCILNTKWIKGKILR